MNIGSSMIKIAVMGLLVGSAAISSAAGAAGMVQLPAVSPQAMGGQLVGHHSPSAELDISVALPLRNQAALEQFLRDLRNPHSIHYGKFLTQARFATAYGPTQAQVTEVETFLKQRGLKVTSVSKSRTRIHATGSTATVESAFGVAVNDYSYQGSTYYATTTGPSLPQNVAALVTHVFGLENMLQYRSHAIVSTARATGGVGPGPEFSPLQTATAYGWPTITAPKKGALPAAGVTVAIATAFTFRQADVDHFWSTYGLPSHTVTVIPIDGVSRQLEFETTLDVEESSSLSPGSNMLVYEALNPGDEPFDDMFLQIADDNKADVVSTSWGLAEVEGVGDLPSMQSEHASFQQMVAEGMTFLAASGDDGSPDRASGNDNADFPASDPLTVAAGGTSLTLNSDNTIASEVVWNDGPSSAAGGADSILFAQPDYQSGISGLTPNTSCGGDETPNFPSAAGADADACAAAGAASRQNSDIAMDADPQTGYTTYFNGRWGAAGGTSYVAPEMAGFFAIVTARLRTAAKSKTARVGQGNPWLYQDFLANPGDFNDITSGNNGMFPAGTGWDHPTGLGTPNKADTMMNHLVTIMRTP